MRQQMPIYNSRNYIGLLNIGGAAVDSVISTIVEII